ncbi:hypothetical protein ANO14919_104720 [Xylariales sp. No.14919]|nr:hypothetical protein ANO14919_104720 [Xylariales sp. No.14919]
MGFEDSSMSSPGGRNEGYREKMPTKKSNAKFSNVLDIAVILFSVLTAITVFGFITVFLIQPNSFTSSISVHSCAEPPIRREWRSLKTHEREEYLSAVKCLYNASSELVGKGSIIDDFTWVHIRAVKAAHDYAAFLPWHRMLLHIYEQKLRQHCGFKGQLPYWDWTSDWQNLTESSIWDDEHGFGGESTHYTYGSCVSGPFSHVELRYGGNGSVSPHCLSRVFTNYDSGEVGSMSGELIRPEMMGRLARSKDYARFRWVIESVIHNIIHTEVVGDLDTEVAPNDPIFWLHHVQLDRLWWLWQREAPQQRLHDYKQHASEPPRQTSLGDMLHYGGLAEGVKVGQVMETENSLLCYKYT